MAETAKSIKFLKKTYPFRDKNAISKTEDQNVSGILNFQNGLQLFGLNVVLEPDEKENYTIIFGNNQGAEFDALTIFKDMIRKILKEEGIEVPIDATLEELIQDVDNYITESKARLFSILDSKGLIVDPDSSLSVLIEKVNALSSGGGEGALAYHILTPYIKEQEVHDE